LQLIIDWRFIGHTAYRVETSYSSEACASGKRS
jgi:hypothetical protein